MFTKTFPRAWVALTLMLIASLACNLTGPQPTATPAFTPTPAPAPTRTPLPPIAPNVVDYDPVRGDELPTDAPITVYFDSPMNHASAEAAFAIEPNVAGAFEWPDDSTLVFKPAANLEHAARYTVTVNTQAKSAAGLALTTPFTFKATTVGYLEVTQVIPAPGTYDVETEAALTILFNRPVVPLAGLEEQANFPSPLTLEPAVEGVGEWLNTSIYVFRPSAPLAGGATYTARIAAGLQDTTGGVLQEGYSWQFTTLTPNVIVSDPYSGQDHVRLNQPISLTFNQKMDHASVEAAFALLTPEFGDKPGHPGTFKWSEDDLTMGFWPAQNLPLDTEIVATLDASARAAGGTATLPFPYVVSFHTVRYPALLRTTPGDGEEAVDAYSGFTFYFASPMDVSTFADHIFIEPQPTTVYTYWSDYEFSYYIGWDLLPSTAYTVTVLPGLADPYGNLTAEGSEVHFTTAARAPDAYIVGGGGVGTFNAYAPDTALYVSSVNIASADFKLYALSVEQFAASSGLIDSQAYANFIANPGVPVREWSQPLAGAVNERAITRVPLGADGGGALAPGAYYLVMRADFATRAFAARGVRATLGVAPTKNERDARARYGFSREWKQTLLVSGANLTLKTGFDEALVWATDLNSGQPIPNLPITLYDSTTQILAQGQTDANGLFTTQYAERDDLWATVWAASTGGPDKHAFAATLSGWSGGLEAWDFGLTADYYPRRHTTYLYTDRPLYRPGQVAYFKGIVRQENDARFSLPDPGSVQVSLFNPIGQSVYSADLSLSELGTFSGEFQLDEAAALGSYTLYVNQPDGERLVDLGSLSFSVAEYRKPEFQVNVSSPVTQVVQGETIPVAVDTTFFFGGPVSNADVRWAVLSADYYFNYTGSGYYDFTNYDYSAGGGGPGFGGEGRLILESQGQTDSQGHATLDVKTDLTDAKQSQIYTIEATVTDLNGQQVSGRIQVLVHQGRFYVGVRPEGYIGQAGQPVNFNLLTVDWNGDPFPNQTLNVEFNDHQWNCAQEQDPDSGATVWACEVQDTLVDSTTITTDANGQATVSFVPPQGGVYQVKATGRDAEGHTVTASTIVWVWSGDFIAWRQENNDRLDLITDRQSYKPGDTAEILITSPFQGETTALVTVERGRILQTEVLRLTTNSTIYQLPITNNFAPDVFVSVVLMKGVDSTNPIPAFKFGLAKLSVSPEQQQLTVTLTPDKTKVGPRDTVTYAIKATDYLGQPVRAEFSVGVTDLALLSLSAPNSGPIMDTFYGERGLGIRTSTGLVLSIDRLNVLAEQDKGGGGGGGEGFNEVRSNFLDTAFWSAFVQTNENGEASVSVTLPDNLTTWRLDARGATADTRVGQSLVDIVATKDLLIRPNTPRFFVVGDVAEIGAVVNNNTAQAIEATVTLTAHGVILNSPATQSITIPANDRAEVTWGVTAEDAEYADLTFSVQGGGLEDSSKPTLGLPPNQLLPIYHYTAPETVGTAGQLDEAGSILEAVSLPRRFDATQGSLDIRLDPSLAAGITDALDYLEHYPYECTEQTVSRFLPNVLTYRALKDLGLADAQLEAKLNELVNAGLQRLYAQQHYDGGWGWWAEDPSDAYISAYVLFGLARAREAGFAVNESVITSAIGYVQAQLIPLPEGENAPWLFNRQAFMLYALAEADSSNESALVNLYDKRSQMSLYANAYLALTFGRSDPQDARIATLLSDLNNAVILSATGAHWEENDRDWWNMNSDTRSTAIVLGALVKLDPDNNLIPNIVRWLMVARTAQAWETTQETVWALISLTDWMVLTGELQGQYAYNVSLNGQPLTTGVVNADTVRESVQLQVAVADLLTDQANQLLINRGAGDGRLYYTAHLKLNLPVEDVRAVSRGIIVSREYTIVSDDCGGPKQDPCPAVTEATAGDDIRVRVTLIAPNDLYYVVLEDPIPAGAEPVDTSLLTTSIVGQPPALNPVDPLYYGWGWWWFSRHEIRDEKVVLFANYLPKGTYQYTYTLHASLPGQYKVIPTHAEEFYFPEVFGRGDGVVFTIKP